MIRKRFAELYPGEESPADREQRLEQTAALAGIGGAIAAMAIGHILPEFAFWTASIDSVRIVSMARRSGAAQPASSSPPTSASPMSRVV